MNLDDSIKLLFVPIPRLSHEVLHTALADVGGSYLPTEKVIHCT